MGEKIASISGKPQGCAPMRWQDGTCSIAAGSSSHVIASAGNLDIFYPLPVAVLIYQFPLYRGTNSTSSTMWYVPINKVISGPKTGKMDNRNMPPESLR